VPQVHLGPINFRPTCGML